MPPYHFKHLVELVASLYEVRFSLLMIFHSPQNAPELATKFWMSPGIDLNAFVRFAGRDASFLSRCSFLR